MRVLLVGARHPSLHLLLQHAHEADKLGTLDLLGVEVVRLRHVEVTDDIFNGVLLEHALLQVNIVVKLLVAPLLKVVNNRHLWRVEFQHNLSWN